MAINNKPAMDSRTIDAFKSKLVGGGARPNLFEVELQWPDFLTSQIDDDVQLIMNKALCEINTVLLEH